MTLEEIIADIHALNKELAEYERKYNLLTKNFYELYTNGELRDEEVEEIRDFSRWAGLYEIRLNRERLYEKTLATVLETARAASPTGQLALSSNSLPTAA